MQSKKLWLTAGTLLMSATMPSMAADLFTVRVVVDGSAERRFGFNNAESAFDQLDADRLSDEFNYNSASAVDTLLDFRGLPMQLEFAAASNTLLLDIPAIGVSEIFVGQGATPDDQRRDALRQAEDFFKSDGGANFRLVQRELVRSSPVDPLAGNPFSLQTRMIQSDFNRGFTHKVSQNYGCGTTAFRRMETPMMVASAEPVPDIFDDWERRFQKRRAGNEIGIGASAAFYESGPFDGLNINLPLSYSFNFDGDARQKLRIELPLSYADIDGALIYGAGLNLAYTHPLTDAWTLTPAIGAGVSGSEELASGGGFYSAAVTSSYTLKLGDWALSIGNGLGYYKSMSVKFGDYKSDPDIANTALTNGLLLSGPSSLLADNLILEYFITDTRLFGDALYSESYDEVGVSLGHVRFESEGVVDSYFKGSLSYLIGENDVKGIRVSLSYRF